MTASRSARSYQERAGLIHTRRGPLPQIRVEDNKAHDYPLTVPLPLPGLIRYENGQDVDGTINSPDRGKTVSWPHR